MLQTVVLHVVVMYAVASKVSADIYIHLHLWISAVVCQRVDMRSRMWHVVRQESTFIEVSSLIGVLLSVRIEFDHHCAIHLGSGHVHGSCIDIVECHHSC